MTTNAEPQASSFGKWMALVAALLGWLFDGLEMGLFPLVQRPALDELVGPTNRSLWIGIITAFFLIGAATGGVLFGWLGDRIGRVRSMMLSVLTYALVSGLCGFATTAWEIGIYRFIAALGMGGEWSLGVALINEIWPNRSRAFLAGLIGAAANVGYMIIAIVGVGVVQRVGELRGLLLNLYLPEPWVDHILKNEGWRFLMMLGALPALLTFFIRAYVPESTKWEREKGKGSTSHWATQDLIGVAIGAVGACGIIVLWGLPARTIALQFGIDEEAFSASFFSQHFVWVQILGTLLGLVVTTWGYTYPAVCYLRRVRAVDASFDSNRDQTLKYMILAACISGVALLGTWGSTQQAPTFADDLVKHLPPSEKPPAKEFTQIATAFGAVVGTILAALVGNWIGRRPTYFLLCVGSLIIVPTFYLTSKVYDTQFLILAFLTGAISASFYGWLPLYLPELFRTAVRATGQGFGFNFGRVIAAVGVLQLGNLRGLFVETSRAQGLHELATVCSCLSLIYLVGMVIIWFVPETHGKSLPE